ncbi:hypothetical protein [Hymenobacter coccineus]|uniref:DUF4890 domain-containing protein n=1 Tax=Hymenobacter coccineus TaxID=1908235 RepID=A0A1G1THZ5_9BACT|nr:hypothetical protein [Hymenobacter coccineus]OGX90468.1 hypothetical protein BEN49_06715 [Hymenobacter coccineus]
MFKSLALLAALALATPSAFAQTAPAAPMAHQGRHKGPHKMKSPEQMAARRSQKMAQQLGLSPDQQSRLQAALLAERQGMTAVSPAPADRKALHQAMKANHAQYEAQVQAILTPAQRTQYTAMQQQKRTEMKAKRQQRTGLAPNN